MAKKNKTTKNMEALIFSMKEKEFLIGLASITAIVVVFVALIYKTSFRKNQTGLFAQKPKIISPIVTETSEQKKTVTPTPTPTPTNKIKQIKQLADTTGYFNEVVRDGDNFWNISKRACGDGKYFESIKESSGYSNRTLLPGEIIRVNCSE